MEVAHALVGRHQVDHGLLVAVHTSVGFEEVHYCVVVGNQVVEVLISQDVLLLDLPPKLAGGHSDFSELRVGVDSKGA